MAGIFDFLFGGKYPSTSKYEKETDKRNSDYKKFIEFADSVIFKRYKELDELVHTGEFEKRVKILKTEKFKDTEAFRKLTDYKSLISNTEVKDYLAMVESGKSEKLDRILKSKSYSEFQALSVLVDSADFKNASKEKDFKSTEHYRHLLSFKKLKKDADIKFANKIMSTIKYKNYKSLLNSDKIKQFEQLKAYVNSAQFAAYRKEIEDSNRFKKSEEFKLLTEFDKLDKNKELVWYRRMKQTNAFAEDARWQLSFEEDFDRSQLNSSKWITGYYWGKALLNDNYVLAGEKQYFKNENIDIRESVAHLITKPEKCKGKIWDAQRGFLPSEFDYSSALISTGQSFRQKYGKFEAKVKLSFSKPLTHNFWMVAENITPQIDIFKYGVSGKKSLTSGLHTVKNKVLEQLTKSVNGADFSSDYYIYSLEWTPSKLIWRINGVEVHSETRNIPDQPMYLVFSSNMTDEPSSSVNGAMAIDWVRCYQLK